MPAVKNPRKIREESQEKAEVQVLCFSLEEKKAMARALHRSLISR